MKVWITGLGRISIRAVNVLTLAQPGRQSSSQGMTTQMTIVQVIKCLYVCMHLRAIKRVYVCVYLPQVAKTAELDQH